jgi:hypothetical protein
VDFSNVNLWAAAISVVLAAAVGAIVQMIGARSTAKKTEVETLQSTINTMQTAHDAEATRLTAAAARQDEALISRRKEITELFDSGLTLRSGQESLRLENQKLVVALAEHKAACLLVQAEMRAEIVALTARLTTTVPMQVNVVNPAVPVEVVRPLPLPMTAAQVAQAEEQAKEQE